MSASILDAREERWDRRRRKASAMPPGWSLVSFTLRMPSSLRLDGRYNSFGKPLFDSLCRFFRRMGMAVSGEEYLLGGDGPEGYGLVLGEADKVKEAAVHFEERHPWGPLADVDVMDGALCAMERRASGLPPRPCYVCGWGASECIVSRAHTGEETNRCALEILGRPAPRVRHDASSLAAKASEALLFEAAAAPKPGLVDPFSKGAHRDMDYFTFLRSAAALAHWWEIFARLGWDFGDEDPTRLLPLLRERGMEAERAMLAATEGVNTHKGLIFSLGILCAAAGNLAAADVPVTERTCSAYVSRIVKGIVERDFSGLERKTDARRTWGEKLYLRYGVTGIRGEVERGFPSVLEHALPRLRADLDGGLPLNDALVNTLLVLCTVAEDTNVLARAGREGADFVRAEANKVLTLGGMGTEDGRTALLALDRLFIDRNISAGGAADLLAVTVFMRQLSTSPLQQTASDENVRVL